MHSRVCPAVCHDLHPGLWAHSARKLDLWHHEEKISPCNAPEKTKKRRMHIMENEEPARDGTKGSERLSPRHRSTQHYARKKAYRYPCHLPRGNIAKKGPKHQDIPDTQYHMLIWEAPLFCSHGIALSRGICPLPHTGVTQHLSTCR